MFFFSVDRLLFRQICFLGLFPALDWNLRVLHGWWAGRDVGAREREIRDWIKGISNTH